MFILYAVPTELKRAIQFFYKHIVPTGLKRNMKVIVYTKAPKWEQ